MDMDSPAKTLELYRDAERAYVDATFPFFSNDLALTTEGRASVKTLHASLDRAREAYFAALKAAGWSSPFREWSARPSST